jgi:ABC-type dipeptide/oligopeptide/nickel transport system permease subunit
VLLIPARFRADRRLQAGALLLAIVVVAGLFAPWLSSHDPLAGDLGVYPQGPGGGHLLGTDAQGRDVLSRVLHGARVSLVVGLVSQTVTILLGVALGLLAGWYGRWVESGIMRLAEITLAFPTLLLPIAIAGRSRRRCSSPSW